MRTRFCSSSLQPDKDSIRPRANPVITLIFSIDFIQSNLFGFVCVNVKRQGGTIIAKRLAGTAQSV
jgi:hypothetical protein